MENQGHMMKSMAMKKTGRTREILDVRVAKEVQRKVLAKPSLRC
jgi:hypothetical protein